VSKCSEADGSYVLKDMPAGQYVITAEPWAKERPQEPKLFYPGTAERKSAEVLSIGGGEHIAGSKSASRNRSNHIHARMVSVTGPQNSLLV
jgi:hypothetical protein